LFRPAIPSPYAGTQQPKIVYIQHHTPFMSAVQRVRRLLAEIEKRASQSVVERAGHTARGDPILAAATADMSDIAAFKEQVTIKGSGRAIEKVLNLASFFSQRETDFGIKVRLATGTTSAIDDIELDDDVDSDAAADVPDSRLRQISVLEVKISHS
jgi:ribonuclease P/MRP protein subunit POP7